jgi:hypothetical protein
MMSEVCAEMSDVLDKQIYTWDISQEIQLICILEVQMVTSKTANNKTSWC